MNVYVVTDFVLEGAFVGIFSSREKAEKAIKSICHGPWGHDPDDFLVQEKKLDAISEDYK